MLAGTAGAEACCAAGGGPEVGRCLRFCSRRVERWNEGIEIYLKNISFRCVWRCGRLGCWLRSEVDCEVAVERTRIVGPDKHSEQVQP